MNEYMKDTFLHSLEERTDFHDQFPLNISLLLNTTHTQLKVITKMCEKNKDVLPENSSGNVP